MGAERQTMGPGEFGSQRAADSAVDSANATMVGSSARERRRLVRNATVGVVTTLTAAALLAACGARTIGSGEGTQPNPTATPGNNPNVQPSPIAPPDVCNVATSKMDSCEINGQKYEVPMIGGVHADVEGGKVVFRADADNPYGLKEGAYAGTFVPGVQETVSGDTENAKSTGALGYTPEVLKVLMEGKPSNTIVLPTDLTGVRNVTIDIDPSTPYGGIVTIDTHGADVAVRNILPGTKKFHVIDTIFTSTDPNDQGLFSDWVFTHPNSITPGHEADYISVSSDAGLKHHSTPTFSFGQEYGTSHGGDVYIGYGLHQSDGANLQKQILNVNGVPVFIAGTPAA